ncbi:XRE family transcriptional regulator [Kibdelosporangium aridum]|uniref:XRE family transcriptional regulator n=1 Tax=Kibdelosporangium aridum TaxID=2030 RepID=A0A428YJL4_KIBAR|nr:helix-turn-helix transcriptional regulator [Kibdelosporangium aridum]RSM67794.1 XRE family transcriptional regulator [Kibdelosporangium aridum]
MSPPVSPIVARWELALRLRRRREHVGVEVRTITQALGFSRNYWSAVENERKILSEESLVRLLDLFEFDDEERDELLALRAAAKGRGWWARYSAILDDELQRFFGLEYGAHSVRGYESLLVPGLLQTAEYARALMTSEVTLRRVEVDQFVEVRMHRQERLGGDSPLQLTELISEAALRQEIGGPPVLRRQLEHLTRMIEKHADTIELRVIPFTAPACGLFGASTVNIIDFENPRLHTIIWQETVTSWGVIDNPTNVRDISGAYRDGLRRALSSEDSLALIHQRIKELG